MVIDKKEDISKMHNINTITIAPRRGFRSDFEQSDPILRIDELVIIYDDIVKSSKIDKSMYGSFVMYKRGDGTTHFNDLPYIDAYDAINEGLLYMQGTLSPSAKIDLSFRLHEDDMPREIQPSNTGE